MKVLEMLQKQLGILDEDVNYFILDSHEESDYGDKTYISYSYSTRQFNKLKSGDIFIYRVPSNRTKNNRFYFFGGGVIDQIVKINEQGLVKAYIKHPFKLLNSITQDDVTDFPWTYKKRGATWRHFFNQYGMNKINETDFRNLLKESYCVPFIDLSPLIDIEEETIISTPSPQTDFSITIRNAANNLEKGKRVVNSKKIKNRKINYLQKHMENIKIGDFGELKILQYEIENLIESGRTDLAELVEHSSKIHGDGLGYDIKSFETDGTEKYIEVKTTRSNNIAGFHISPREIQVSNEKDNYHVYRLYNVKETEGTADLCIFSGPCNDEKFNLTPTSFRVTLK